MKKKEDNLKEKLHEAVALCYLTIPPLCFKMQNVH